MIAYILKILVQLSCCGSLIRKNALLLIEVKLVIGKHLKLSPAFPLLRTERDSFPSFRVPSSDGIINYKFQVTLVELG